MNKRGRLVQGVGINDAGYQVSIKERVNGKRKEVWHCPYHRTWTSMLVRCYNEKSLRKCPTYEGCRVTDEWHRFSVFKEWMRSQQWEGKQLDKDILTAGNRIYGPESCVFVSRELNSFLTDCSSSRGDHPVGVCCRRGNRAQFESRCRNPFTGKEELLGYFTSPESAHEAWRARKHELACKYADMQTNSRLANALRSRFKKRHGDVR